MGHRRGGKGRLRALHDEGDLRAARGIAEDYLPRIRDGKIVLDNITLTKEQIQDLRKVFIVACGTSYHVGVVAKYAFERLLKIPLEVDVASEFRYRDPILDEKTLVIIISQSGETADTLAALRMAKKRGCRILSIVNVVGSTIANESDDVLYTWAGRRSPWPPPRPTAPSWR